MILTLVAVGHNVAVAKRRPLLKAAQNILLLLLSPPPEPHNDTTSDDGALSASLFAAWRASSMILGDGSSDTGQVCQDGHKHLRVDNSELLFLECTEV